MLSLSGHKFRGPRGTGVLYVKKGITLEPLVYGGGQERGLVSGTENTAGCIGPVSYTHLDVYKRQ